MVEQAKKILEKDPSLQEVYCTSDGYIFKQRGDANRHASASKASITTVDRSALEVVKPVLKTQKPKK